MQLDSELVAIPDDPHDLSTLDETVSALTESGCRFRIDPVLEPIGFGFAASLARYFEARRKWPDTAVMMGIGNLTELTEVDTVGMNVLLAGICQELGIRSVLTTEVINWARSAVREFDIARRLVHFSITRNVLPKHASRGERFRSTRKSSTHRSQSPIESTSSVRRAFRNRIRAAAGFPARR